MNIRSSVNIKTKILSVLLVLILVLTSCTGNNMDESISDSRFLIGTIISLELFGTSDESLLDGSFAIIEEIDQLMSLNIEGSELNNLNANAGKGPYEVSEQTFTVIKKALEYGGISNGGFDITLEPVISLWNIGSDDAAIPASDLLDEKLRFVDYTKVKLNESDLTVELEEGMSIDLGGIGKGYSADLVAEYLRNEGVEKAILNLGGNILVIGEKAEDTPFRVGLQNPFDNRNEYFGVVEASNKTVVTSGIYERNFTQDDVLYHHILDTVTGYPVNNGVASVSIIADESIEADALSTVLFVLGIEEGIKLANELDGVECIFVSTEGHVTMSDGAGVVTTITDESFTQ